jgi:glycosyltransferase involved in cell wall biosynthesis
MTGGAAAPRRRLVAVHPVPDRSGADLMLVRSLVGLRDRGYDVCLFLPEAGPLQDVLDDAGIDHEVIGFPVLRKALLRPLALLGLAARLPVDLARLVRVIRRSTPAVVYVNTITLPHCVLAARLARVPVVCHVRERESSLPAVVSKLLTAPLWAASRLVANSQATAAHLTATWPRLRSRIRVVYNGVELPAAAAVISRVADSPRRIMVIGRLSPRKGQHIAVEAVARLREAGYDVTLELVGTAFRGYEWYVEQLTTLARDRKIAEHVTLTGYRSPAVEVFAEADIAVVPSLEEPFGTAAVEAMLAGRPLVVSDVGGLPEIVGADETGLVVPPGDAQALADAVASLLDDAGRATSMAARGNADVRDRFGIDRYLDELATQIAEVVAA